MRDTCKKWEIFEKYQKPQHNHTVAYQENLTDKLTQEDIERFKKKGFTFYIPVDNDDTIMASDSLKDWIKCEVGSALLDIDIKSKGNK